MSLSAQNNSIGNSGVPLIQNFSSKDYYYENVNWDAVQDHLGTLYFANNSGILKYYGNTWTIIETEARVISICFDSIKKMVYVGTENDIGFIDIDEDGKSKFVSLLKKYDSKEEVSVIWYSIYTPYGVFFVSNEKIIQFHNNKLHFFRTSTSFAAAFYANGNFFVREKEKGLLYYKLGQLKFLEGTDLFAQSSATLITHIDHNKYLVASRDKGLLELQIEHSNSKIEGTLKPINTTDQKLIIESSIYRGLNLKNGEIALASQLNGLLIINKQGKLVTHLNADNGLNSDIINNVYEDNVGNLWLSTENGISLVNYSMPEFVFKDNNSFTGIAETSIVFNGNFYVGTSTGLFILNKQRNVFERLNFPSIQVWKLLAVNSKPKQLLVATKQGIYEVTNTKSERVSFEEGFYTLYESKVNPGIIYAGHLGGLNVYRHTVNGLQFLHKISKVNSVVRSIVEDKYGNLWLSSENEGLIFCKLTGVNLNSSLDNILVKQFTTESGLPNLSENYVYEINDKLVVTTYDGLYQISKNIDFSSISLDDLATIKFERSNSGFNPYINEKEDIQIRKLIKDPFNNIWLASQHPNGRHEIGVEVENKGKYYWNTSPFKMISKEKITSIYPTERYVWFGSSDMMYMFDKSKKYPYKKSYNAIIHTIVSNSDTLFCGNYFDAIGLDDEKVNLISAIQPKPLKVSYPYKFNDFTFYYSATNFIANNNLLFSCILEGEDNKWSEWKNEPSKTYMNLSEGRYTFKVRAKNVFGTESMVCSYNFKILPPWYRTTFAYIIYFILSVGFIFIVVKFFTDGLKRIITNQTAELQQQKDEIEHKNKEITDSIYYAKRIQDAIMPSNEYIKTLFAESFVFFRPKDIVSGDFYWANLRDNHAIIAAVDCTGHGVPGAFMSMMGNDYLNDIIVDSKITEPQQILNRMRSGIIKALKQRGESGESKDGMDMALVNFDKNTLILEYAGANNPIYIVRDKKQQIIDNSIIYSDDESRHCIYEIKGNKFPVGIHMGTTLQEFTKRSIQLVKGDVFYLFSDGFADQFGGPLAKKLKYNQFKKFIIESMFLTMEEQKIYLEQKFNDWKGELEQVDDVLVIGIRV